MRFHQGKYKIKNPKKYRGDFKKIIYRSSYELKMMRWCDSNSSVLKWNSEEVVIPYVCRTDGKTHRYYMDFWIRQIDEKGEIKDKLIEIKPYAQTQPPKKGRNYKGRMLTYMKNISKWEAAKEWSESHGCTFHIITEKQLNIK